MKRIGFLFYVVLLLQPGLVMAQGNWFFGLSGGVAVVDSEAFSEGSVTRLYGGYAFNPYFSLETSTYYFDKIPSKEHDEVFIQGYGQTLGVAGRLPIEMVSIGFSAGVFGWHMESHAFSEQIGEDEGGSPYAGFGVTVALPAHMAIGGQSVFFHDVSGSDLSTHSIVFGLAF